MPLVSSVVSHVFVLKVPVLHVFALKVPVLQRLQVIITKRGKDMDQCRANIFINECCCFVCLLLLVVCLGFFWKVCVFFCCCFFPQNQRLQHRQFYM